MTPIGKHSFKWQRRGGSRAKVELNKIKKRSRREGKRNLFFQCAIDPCNYEKGKVVQARKSFMHALQRNY